MKIITIVLLMAAWAYPCYSQDSKARFSGIGYVVAGSPTQCLGSATYERVTNEVGGLLTPVLTTKWVITVVGCYGQQEQARRRTNITATSYAAVNGGASYGTYDISVPGWGLLTILAANPALRPSVGYTENRNQWFSLHEIDEFTFQIIIEE